MRSNLRRLSYVVCLSGLLLGGCKKKGADAVKVPDAPDKAILQAITALKSNKPVEVYGMLPKSYRKDVQDVISQATAGVDKDLFELAVKILDKARSALEKQGEAISKVGIPNAKESIKAVKDAHDLAKSAKLLDYAALKKFNVERFLANHGPKLMQAGRTLSEKNKPREYKKFQTMLSKASVKVESNKDGKAEVTVAIGDKKEKVKLVKVEGAWLPAEMANDWKKSIDKAKKQIAQGIEKMNKNKAQTKKMMEGVLAMLTEFEKSGDMSKLKGIMRAM